jgi:hypothetical protein
MQTKKNNLILLLLLCSAAMSLSFVETAHPFYLSSTELKVDTKKKRAEVSCKIFLDDLQRTLAQINHKKVDLAIKKVDNKTMLESYLKAHLLLSLGKQKLVLTCIGYEIEEEAVWCYLEGSFKQASGDLMIENSILCNEFSSQTNLLHVTFDGAPSVSHKLVCPEQSWIFKR